MDEKQLQQRFGRLVAAHRRRVGKTQEELAADTGISVDMITRLEGGGTGVRFPNIAKIANALGVDPAELFTSEIPSGALQRAKLANVVARLARMSDKELDWAEGVLEAALKPK